MIKLIAAVATFAAGSLFAFQPLVNAQLARKTSVLAAALFTTATPAILIALVMALTGRFKDFHGLAGMPVVHMTGGLIGVVLISVSLITVRHLGASALVAAIVSGQLLVSAVADRFGVLGLEPVELSAGRIVGLLLLFVGTFLVVNK